MLCNLPAGYVICITSFPFNAPVVWVRPLRLPCLSARAPGGGANTRLSGSVWFDAVRWPGYVARFNLLIQVYIEMTCVCLRTQQRRIRASDGTGFLSSKRGGGLSLTIEHGCDTETMKLSVTPFQLVPELSPTRPRSSTKLHWSRLWTSNIMFGKFLTSSPNLTHKAPRLLAVWPG